MPKILIIDDEPDILLMIKKMLERSGYEVDLATDGKDGFNLLKRISFDLVITDIIMPEKEGLELITEIRKNYPHIKIIAISGGGRISADSYLECAKHLGASRIFQKPFGHKEFVAAVMELIG